MAKYEGYRKQLESLENALQSDAKAVELSLQRYKIGKTNFQRVLDSQLQLLQDSQASTAARANANIQLVRLYRSIGGGWPGHTGEQASLGCAECAGGRRDFGGSNQAIPHEIIDGGTVNHDQNGPVVLEHSGSWPSNVGATTVEESQRIQGSNTDDAQALRKGKTVLQIDETIPAPTVLPSNDFSPIEFTPDLGRSQQRAIGPVGQQDMSKELFDWSGQDAALVKTTSPIRKPVQPVASLNYFIESPELTNKQSTQKASLNQPAATEWMSDPVSSN